MKLFCAAERSKQLHDPHREQLASCIIIFGEQFQHKGGNSDRTTTVSAFDIRVFHYYFKTTLQDDSQIAWCCLFGS